MVIAIRNHWSIEVYDWIRDIQMGEDRVKIINEKDPILVAGFMTVLTDLLENYTGDFV